MTIPQRIILLLACVAVSLAPGAVGGRFEPGVWYEALDKPPLTPPGWSFPVVWTALYIAMGVSLYLFVTAAGRRVPALPIALFAAQLVLNGAWSWLFFGLQRPAVALANLLALWIAVVAVTALFGRRRLAAGALLLPYLIWISFALYLNAAIWLIN